ncbi:MAG TPA: 3-dehydroquinate synthase [Chitinophagaceae bacterium]|nr:3-dehydroquinate synthase [Chitinophagaceae bacterium]
MNPERYTFSKKTVDYYFSSSVKKLGQLADKKRAIVITDDNVFAAHKEKLKGWNVISLKPGEEYKIQATVDAVIDTLIEMKADRRTFLVGMGGGVITDLTGYIASIYMRGLDFGFVPTSLLAMVDAAIGGKNGIDVGEYKNMVGVIRQPSFLLYDTTLLRTLPAMQWSDGFAEIIKHACIKDARAFGILRQNDIASVQKDETLLASIIRRNALLKTKVVLKDEFEKADRKLLNFGHTLGHAIETQYELSHGQAVSLGMIYASLLSQELLGFKDTEKVSDVLEQYGLPVAASFKMEKVLNILKMDKKRVSNHMSYILLEKIGKGVIYPIELKKLEQMLKKIGS